MHTYYEDEFGDIKGDIGYHWLIDPNGNIYEGRSTSSQGNLVPTYNVRGAHIRLGNTCTMGICLLSEDGNFEISTITTQQDSALLHLLAWKFHQQRIKDPREIAIHHSISQYRIEEHNKWPKSDPKECPGTNVSNQMVKIREDVFTLLLTECLEDTDSDTIPDAIDNCPTIFNPGQEDWNFNGIGDACEDSDEDGINDSQDNCYNSLGINVDIDQDSIPDECDNCPYAFNPDQSDIDADGFGDDCDPDMDGDGIDNSIDNCPEYYNPDQTDSNGDGIGDACETLDCADPDVADAINAMEACVDRIFSDMNSQIQDLETEKQACIDSAIHSYPANVQHQIENEIKFQNVWRHNISRFSRECSQTHPDEVESCILDKMDDALNAAGYDENIPTPSNSSWELYLQDKCECTKQYYLSLAQIYLDSGRLALRCFNATVDQCNPHGKGKYTRSYWLEKIRQGQMYLSSYSELDCSGQHY